jgi:hypothetical protein
MACTQILAGITLDCASSVGGIKEVYIANYDDVTEVVLNGDIITGITSDGAVVFKKYEFKIYHFRKIRRVNASCT